MDINPTTQTAPLGGGLTARPSIAGGTTDTMAKAFAPAQTNGGAANPQPSVPRGFMPDVKMPGADAQAFGTGLAAQYQSLMASAKEAARSRMRFGADAMPGGKPAQGGIFAALGAPQGLDGKSSVQAAGTHPGAGNQAHGASQPGGTSQPPQGAQNQPKPMAFPQPEMGQAAMSNKVTMGRGIIGGKQVPTFMRGNSVMELPSGIDLRDDKAVQAAMDDANLAYDFMNTEVEDL